MAQIADAENLRLAFWKAARGKRPKGDCRVFQKHLDSNLAGLRAELLSGRVAVGDYHSFRILDPKERTIHAPSFRERVLHHALMNVCEPVLDRAAVFDSYACRQGKGQLAAVRRAQSHARRHSWFLKLDVRKYFDSVDHRVLLRLLGRKFKDPAVLEVFASIVASYQTGPGRGVPIGNLTSQHFANFYLAPLDRFVKERLGRRAYVRYMDDCVVWGGSKEELRRVWLAVAAFLADELALTLKPNTILNRTDAGMDFLGYRVYPHQLRLCRRSKRRFVAKFRRYEGEGAEGRWTELQLQQRMQALVAFTLPCRSWGFRRRVLQRFGVAANGLEPRDPRRQLEQQRDELPVSEPQQQQPGQCEQQPWIPGCAGPSSTGGLENPQADPAAILSSKRSVTRQRTANEDLVLVAEGPPQNLRAFRRQHHGSGPEKTIKAHLTDTLI